MSKSSAPAIDPAALRKVLWRQSLAEQAPWLHQEVARRMAERLQVIRQAPANWLDWRAFSGAGAEPVQAIWPQAVRHAVESDLAAQARSQTLQKAPWWAWGSRREAGARPVWLESDVPDGQAAMLWANLVLHNAIDPQVMLAHWHRALAVDGFLMFSTFGPDTLKDLREVYAQCGWPAPHAPFVDMHDLGDMMVHGGFADPVMDQETLTLTWSSPQALVTELRSLGGHLGVERFPALRGRGWLQRLHDALAARADAQGRIALRFELVYGHAYKPAPRPARGELTTVSLESLRAKLPKRET